MTKYLVSSGCSFSDNCKNDSPTHRWPQFLAEKFNLSIYNYGQGSAGNDWISQSTIYGIHQLLKSGIPSNEILVAVMWSGINRYGLYITKEETIDFDSYINFNDGMNNPINIIDFVPNICTQQIKNSGWLIGSPMCTFYNKKINDFKRDHYGNFQTEENLVIQSYNYFLQLQWFCESKKIKLINMTFKNIFYHPQTETKILMCDRYKSVKHLHELINFDNWLFFNSWDGLYEYTSYNKLKFMSDGLHPHPSAHKHYVDNFLEPFVLSKLQNI